MSYVKERKPCRMLSKFTFEKQIEDFAIEIDMRDVTWLLVWSVPVHLNAIKEAIKSYSKMYEKILIAGYFNVRVKDIKLDIFCSMWNLKH